MSVIIDILDTFHHQMMASYNDPDPTGSGDGIVNQAFDEAEQKLKAYFLGLVGEDVSHSSMCLATSMSREGDGDPPEAFESNCDCDAVGRNYEKKLLRERINE